MKLAKPRKLPNIIDDIWNNVQGLGNNRENEVFGQIYLFLGLIYCVKH